MSDRKLYRFRRDFGRMGHLEGVFVTTEEEIESSIGMEAYFGEVLGKHSEVWCELERSDFEVITEDLSFITKAVEYGLVPAGRNPLLYLQVTCSRCDETEGSEWMELDTEGVCKWCRENN